MAPYVAGHCKEKWLLILEGSGWNKSPSCWWSMNGRMALMFVASVKKNVLLTLVVRVNGTPIVVAYCCELNKFIVVSNMEVTVVKK